jgi:myo-inositol-1-phosphate synthase
LTELGSLPLTGDPREERMKIPEILDLLPLGSLKFAGIDIFESSGGEAAATAGVLREEDQQALGTFLEGIPLFPGLHEESAAPGLEPRNTIAAPSVKLAMEAVCQLYRDALEVMGCERGVVVLSCSTETRPETARPLLETVEDWKREGEAAVTSPALVYAMSAVECGLPFINLTPNLTIEHPIVAHLATSSGLPVAGSDLKSGQTYLKTLIASGLQYRLLDVASWFSTNILGNRDGQVLENQRALQAKKETKGRALDELLNPKIGSGLYEQLHQLVHIHYFPPKGDNKEAWDSISLNGWLGYPMELKVNFQCRDSILAAPLVVDLIRFTELAWRKGQAGPLDWLASYFKSPVFSDPEQNGKGHHFIYQALLLEEAIRDLAEV